jgi:hypothetical protein
MFITSRLRALEAEVVVLRAVWEQAMISGVTVSAIAGQPHS